MLIGVPKEIKDFEFRVGMTPSSVREVTSHGHRVIIQEGAGQKIGFTDSLYQQAGALIASDAEAVYAQADMIVKVKEPQERECKMMRHDQILFAYLHLAPDPKQTKALQVSGCIAIAYETVTNDQNGLPLLAPMSEIAGRLAIQAGANSLEIKNGGRGVLLGGVSGVAPAKVVVLGGGVVGSNAVRVAIGMGANVSVIDKSLRQLSHLDLQFGSRVNTIFSTVDCVEENICDADLVVGAVLIPGSSAPRVLTKNMLNKMRPGSVVVDVSIDQGGCLETSRPTTHTYPTYVVEGVVHYCVANMPSAVPLTSSVALNNATLPFILSLANQGYKEAMRHNRHLRNGLNICKGQITHKAVAEALHQPFIPAADIIEE